MLTPPHRYFRGTRSKPLHPSYFVQQKYKNFTNKVLFLVLLGIALVIYGVAFAYMK